MISFIILTVIFSMVFYGIYRFFIYIQKQILDLWIAFNYYNDVDTSRSDINKYRSKCNRSQINTNASNSNANFDMIFSKLDQLNKELALLQHKYKQLLKEED